MQFLSSTRTTVKLLAVILFLVLANQIKATTYTDRNAFLAAAQNLRSYDFNDQTPTGDAFTITKLVVDGIVFTGFGSIRLDGSSSSNKLVRALTVGESTRLTVDLPPGTTAVAFEESGYPVKVQTSTGEEFTFTNQGAFTFVGFTSDAEIRSLRLETVFDNTVARDIYLDNLLVGQKSSSQPVAPILFADLPNALPVALDSVTMIRNPFPVVAQWNFSADKRTRITVFAVNVVLTQGQGTAAVRIRAEDAQHRLYELPVESINNTGLTWLKQITAKLTDELIAASGPFNITLIVNGAESNKLAVNITPQ